MLEDVKRVFPEICIESDGNPNTTSIKDDSGNTILNVASIKWEISAENIGELTLKMCRSNIKIKGVPKLIKMRKWFKTQEVYPTHVASYLNSGWKIIYKKEVN